MSSVVLVQPVVFGSDPKITDNSFMIAENITDAKQQRDESAAFQTLRDLRQRITEHGMQARIIRNCDESTAQTNYVLRGDAIFPNNYISFHNFTDSEGRITRRLVILYPMSLYRQKELAEEQIAQKLEAAAAAGKIELLDLRSYEEEGRCLEGTGALNFSPDGRYVYMSRSGRSDDEILDVICSEQYLNIPKENRFLFTSAVPRVDGGKDVVYHTNVIGWCGKGIAVWAMDLLTFDTEEEKAAFRQHLEREYDRLIDLSADDIRAFAGNAFELATRKPDGSEHHFVCMSATAYNGMSEKNRKALDSWYGEENVCSFAAETVERRTGGSIRCMLGASILHGTVLPRLGEASALDIAGIVEKIE
ncbi:Amidinotransferase [Novymonas esmeraldas]|uniref:Amidinotransferase n=1 Tax=Novymonas esmeraldas TaxID=1808958 RepID=A0AAW0EZ32_9TRYP